MRVPLFLAAIGFLLVVGTGSSAGDLPNSNGKVIFVDGDVTANDRIIDEGDPISGLTVFRTGRESSLEVVFGGKNVFRLGSDTVAEVNFDSLQKTVFLEKGEFSSVLKQLGRVVTGTPFLLKTPTLNAGVRGTSFHVSTDGTTTYFCTCNGSVALDDGTGHNVVVLANAHHGARLYTRGADGQVTVTEAGLQGHSDADIEALAKNIGVAIDWTKADVAP